MLTEALEMFCYIASATFNNFGDNGSGIIKPDFYWNSTDVINANLKVSHFHITLNLILGSEVIKVVISVNDYKQIRQRYLNGESQRSIAKSMGISRNTVKKYCEGENVPWERKTPEREASVLTEDEVHP